MTPAEPQRRAPLKAMTGVAVVATASFLGVCLLSLFALAWNYSLIDELATFPGSFDPAAFEAALSLDDTLTTVTWVILLACVVAFVAWSRTARRAAAPFGATGSDVLRHWTLPTGLIGVAVSLVLEVVLNRSAPTDFADLDEMRDAVLIAVRNGAISMAVRMAAVGLLIVGVLAVARRLRELAELAERSAFRGPWTFPEVSEPTGVDVRHQDGPRTDFV